MSGILCNACHGYFISSKHPCAAVLLKENQQLNEELMRRDTMPDFERGELEGQDAMMRHIAKLTEESNSSLAAAVRKCDLVRVRGNILKEVAEYLEYAGYKLGSPHDIDAAKAFHAELGIIQKRAEIFGIGREEEPWPPPKNT